VGVLSPWVKTTTDRERCRNIKERVTVNKKKIIEKGNKETKQTDRRYVFLRLRARGNEMYFSFVVMRNLEGIKGMRALWGGCWPGEGM